MYYIQSRWKLENRKLHYYGLRSAPNMFKNDIAVSKKQAKILASLPRELNPKELSVLKRFIGKQVVAEHEQKPIPKDLSEAIFCTDCCANDFLIPGLEFDDKGLCPLCQTAEEVKNLKSVVPIVDDIPRSKKSRFDIALFYTGGKDSTYLLYYLSKVKGLRVLALTWEIPYISEHMPDASRNAEQQLLEDSFVKIAGIVMGRKSAEKLSDERIITKNAIDEILKYYHFKPVDIPESIEKPSEQLKYCLRPYGLMSRTIELEEGWYKDAFGPVLAFTKEGNIPVALLPDHLIGYRFKDPVTGKIMKLNRRTSAIFDKEAICFYRPLPQKKLNIPDLLIYMKNCINISDIVLIVAATAVVSLIGLLMPRITRFLTGPVLGSGQKNILFPVAIAMICIAFSSQLFGSIKSLIQSRLSVKTSLGVQASMMMRLMALPANFFRRTKSSFIMSAMPGR